ncbi:MAG: hypothetical protein V7K67_08065 [Nostoc sp.]|uniref:hypothetical protein n=1 Tax=Nostoc sp. TaxID=1180 RepID=UPI002FF58DF6
MLYHKPGVPLAVIEAKDNNHSVSAGMQQAIATGELIDVPFIFNSNGDAFMMCDRTINEYSGRGGFTDILNYSRYFG